MPEAIAAIERAIAWYKQDMMRWEEEAATFGNFRSAFMGLVDRQGNVDHYGGWLRVVDADGNFLADKIDPKEFNDYIGEAVEPWSYLKSTYWKPMGYPDGIYRVGPLARLNVADRMRHPARRRGAGEVPLARGPGGGLVLPLPLRAPDRHAPRDREDRGAARGARTSSSKHTRSVAGINRNEGIGVSEAPRGTLMHHYKVDDNGLVEWANLVIATGHNNAAMNRAVLQVARKHVKGDRLEEPMLNRVEAVIRCYDPCLSCSTHALGQMALQDPAAGARTGRCWASWPGDRRRRVPRHPARGRTGRIPAGPVLVVGYGNSLRSDDGVGPAVAARLAGDPRLAGVDHQERAPADAGARGRRQPGLAAGPRGRGDRRGAGRGVGAPPRAVARRGRDRVDASPRPVGPRGARAGALGVARRRWSWSASAPASLEVGEGLSEVVAPAVTRAADLVATVVEAHRRA